MKVRSQVLFAPGGGDAQGPVRILRVSKVSFNYWIKVTHASIALGIHHLASTNDSIFTFHHQATTAMT